jgi:hypothetical protein
VALLGFQWSIGDIPSWLPQDTLGTPVWTHQIQCGVEPNVDEKYCIYADVQIVALEFSNDPLSLDPDFPGSFWRNFYQYGTFFIKAKCMDFAGVESEVRIEDLSNMKGALAPILNRDPDTRLRPIDGQDFPVVVRYHPYGSDQWASFTPAIRRLTPADDPDLVPGFHYIAEDTLPWGQRAEVTFNMQGWDLDDPLLPQGETIQTRFQMDYVWRTPNLGNPSLEISASSRGRYPGSASDSALGYSEIIDDVGVPHWGDAGQHYFMNLLPVDYVVRGYALDHYKRLDGTPFTLRFTAGFATSVDSVVLSSIGQQVVQRVEILNRTEPVNIELVAFPDPNNLPPEVIRFAWDEGSNTATVLQMGDTLIVEEGGIPTRYLDFDLQFKIYGHDDPQRRERAAGPAPLGSARLGLRQQPQPVRTQAFLDPAGDRPADLAQRRATGPAAGRRRLLHDQSQNPGEL